MNAHVRPGAEREGWIVHRWQSFGQPDGTAPTNTGDAGRQDGTPGADVFVPSASCDRENVGPVSTWKQPIETSPWELVAPAAPDGGAENEPPDSGADAGIGNACRERRLPDAGGLDSSARDVYCSGFATVENAHDGPVLWLEGGYRLVWTPTVPAVSAPAVTAGDTVWVEYVHDVETVCPFCGTSWNDQLQVRETPNGRILWFAREGHDLDDVDDTLTEALFGVNTERDRTECTWRFTAGCNNVERTAFDRRLMTMPVQRVPRGTIRRVSTPKGNYDVLWAYTEERQVSWRPQCSDGPDIASATGFAASWIAENDDGV